MSDTMLPGATTWRASISTYAAPSLRSSAANVATSVIPYLALMAAMFVLLRPAPLLAAALVIPAAGFLVRTFIVFHDCTHGSFLPSKRANRMLGGVLGVLLFTPFAKWGHEHARHHASAGDLGRRGTGDVHTLTVAEYSALSPRGRFAYRASRSPFVMLTLGPIWAMIVQPRFPRGGERTRLRRSVIATDAALAVLIGAVCLLVGWQEYLLIQGPVMLLAGAAGIWLFYVQHQFEDVYWERSEAWSYDDAALRGTSYLRLPRVLRFFSGNIGLHHVHHLSARIPNYRLQRAHDENAIFHDVPQLTWREGMRTFRLKLWDEENRRMVGFS
jgi:omega-6 fatty acid desaturase (delta-12 desaturase)